jgi:hypothetical protein
MRIFESSRPELRSSRITILRCRVSNPAAPASESGLCASISKCRSRRRETMIVLATAAALAGGLTADAFARGGEGGGGGCGRSC